MTLSVLEATLERCSNCGHEFSPDETQTCSLCHSSVCPKCGRCNCAPFVAYSTDTIFPLVFAS